MAEIASILVIRRDNIGDLVCTTPLISALRQNYPRAWIGILANSYNAAALEGNPDVDEVFAYRKLKHLGQDDSKLDALAGRISMLWALRRRKIDLAIVASGIEDTRGTRLARLVGPSRIIHTLEASPEIHEVERTFTAARLLGIEGPIPPLRVVPNPASVSAVRKALSLACMDAKHPLIGIHISARRPSQRWPADRFAELVAGLKSRLNASTILFWSPGAETHPQHPGDDGKASTVIARLDGNVDIMPYPTMRLPDLIAALSICDAMVCSDGGAMHLAAGLSKPIACFFGDSPVARWRPWGVPHVILQATSHNVEDVSVEEVLIAAETLLQDRHS